jgi:hypothetical protein
MDRWPQQALEGLLRQMDQIALSQLKDLIGKIRNKLETARTLPQGQQLAILGILLVPFIRTSFKWKNRLERNTLMWGPLSSVFTPRWASSKSFIIQEGSRFLFEMNQTKGFFKIFINEKFRNDFISLPVFYLIMCLMKAPKNFEKIAILKIWRLVSF